MAEVKVDALLQKLELSAMERAWVRASLKCQRGVLVRSVAKEIVGSDIEQLRRREIAQVDLLLARV